MKRKELLENSIGAIIEEGRLKVEVHFYNMKHLGLINDAVNSCHPLVLNKQGDRSMTLYRKSTATSVSTTRTRILL